MRQVHVGRRCFCAILSMVIPISLLYGQTTPRPPASTNPPAQAQEDKIVTLTECEGVDNCATWTFLGNQGNGQWRTGEVANLYFESVKLNGDNTASVVIHRRD